jgi:hypothetical protein
LHTAVILLTAFLIYQLYVLPSLLHGGATKAEFNQTLPGDELVLKKDYKNTIVVTIQVPPSHTFAVGSKDEVP